MSLGFGFSLPAYNGYAAAFGSGASLALDFTSGRLDPRITFSRTTNATVTGSNGLIQYAPHNLLTFSEQFDNAAWGKVGSSVTANTALAPNGTITADTVTFTGASQELRQLVTAPSGPVTTSLYIKGIVGETVKLDFAGNGSLMTLDGTWQRISTTQTSAGTAAFVSINTYGGATARVFSVWGAQLEVGSTAGVYNPTTVKNLLGFTENFDNAAWTKSNSFVQTNLVTFSEQFDNAAGWTATAATVSANTEAAPNGTITADSLIESGTNAAHILGSVAQNITSGLTYTMSVYAKAGTRSVLQIAPSSSAFGATTYANFDLSAGVVSASAVGTASIFPEGNGWFRCVFVVVSAITGSTGPVNLVLQNSPTAARAAAYAGDGTSGIFLWGAQLVQGATPGDYKATYAAAAAVGYTDIYGQPFAQKLVETTANDVHRMSSNAPVLIGNAPYTLSFYAKAAERTQVYGLVAATTAGTRLLVRFDLLNQTTFTESGSPTATDIEPIGGGWYRCSMTYITAASPTNTFQFVGIWNGAESYTGDGTSGIYIFGAQLSDSASVDPYVYQPVAAPASTAYYGPRFDYDPVTLAPKGLLIEEQRTNLLTYSEQFDNAAWTKTRVAVTANATASPDGTVTADKLIPNATLSTFHIAQVVTTTAAAHTYSAYLKAGEYTWAILYALGVDQGTYFDLVNGVVGSSFVAAPTSSSITSVGDGWYRCSITFTATTSTSTRVYPVPADATTTFTGDGTSGIFLWGAQLEAGAFATSYIPTVTSQVTRAADNASMIGNNFARWYNQTEGTFYAEAFSRQSAGGASRFALVASDGTGNNRIGLSPEIGNTTAGLQVVFAGSVVAAPTIAITNNAIYKIAGAYKINSFNAAVGGVLATEDTSGNVPVVSSMNIGSNQAGAAFVNGNIARIGYWPRRLANSELQAVTA